jgi:hypothetical protein
VVCDAIPGEPQKELCDGKDNNCDGFTDEDFPELGKSCEAGLGERKSVGKYVCSPDGSGVICDAVLYEPQVQPLVAVNLNQYGDMEYDWDSRGTGGNGLPDGISSIISGDFGNSWESIRTNLGGVESYLDETRTVEGQFSWMFSFRHTGNSLPGSYKNLTFTLNLIKNSYPFHDDLNIYHRDDHPSHSWSEFVGRRIIIRLSYWAEGFSNASYLFQYVSGTSTNQNFPDFGGNYESTDTGGWRTIEVQDVLKLANNSTPLIQVIFKLKIRDEANKTATGKIWIDKVECILPDWDLGIPHSRTTAPIYFAVYNFMPEHWTYYLTAPYPFHFAQYQYMAMPLKRILGKNLKWVLYTNPGRVPKRSDTYVPPPVSGCHDLYGCYNYELNYPDWLIHDENNQLIWDGQYNNYVLKIDRRDVQLAASDGYTLYIRDFPLIDSFFLDDFLTWPGDIKNPNTGYYWVPEPSYTEYTNGMLDRQKSREKMFGYWLSYMEEISPLIRSGLGRDIIVNIGSKAGLFLNGVKPMESIMPYIDGVLWESPIVKYDYSTSQYLAYPYTYTGSNIYSSASWRNFVEAARRYPDKDHILIMFWDSDVNGSSSDPGRKLLRYNIATYWLIYRPNIYLCLEDRRNTGSVDYYTHLYTVNQPEVWTPLGEPTGDYQIIKGDWDTGGLFMRKFQNGVVLVNPTDSSSFDFDTDLDYKDWDGNLVTAGTRLTIGPKSGVVLYAAPEVKVKVIASSSSQILNPGGAPWDFVIECSSVGLLPVKNFVLEVPLVSGIRGTLLDGQNPTIVTSGSIKLVIPELSPGDSRRFKVRVRVLGRSGAGAPVDVKILPLFGGPSISNMSGDSSMLFRSGQQSRLRLRYKNNSFSQPAYNIEVLVSIPSDVYAVATETKTIVSDGEISFVLPELPSDPLWNQIRFPWILGF